MTRPEAVDPADVLRQDLRAIRNCWDAMMPKLTAKPVSTIGGTSAVTSTRDGQDNSDDDTDVDRLTVVLSTRHDARATLSSWCLMVIEEKGLQHAKVDGRSIDDLTHFLDRWASWLTEHDAWEEVQREVGEILDRVKACLPRGRPDSVWIGDCPVTLGQDGERITCETPIRVHPDTPIKCPGCGTEDTLDGWTVRIVGSHQPVTAEQLIPVLKKQLGIVVTRQTIRVWVHRKIIEPLRDEHGLSRTDDSDRVLFDRYAVFRALTHRHERSAAM